MLAQSSISLIPAPAVSDRFAEGASTVAWAAERLGQQTLLSRQAASIGDDPVLATAVATTAMSLLLVSAWLLRRRARQGRAAASICLVVSAILHLGLVVLLPHLKMFGGGSRNDHVADDTRGDSDLVFARFDPAAPAAESAVAEAHAALQPLPLAAIMPVDAPIVENPAAKPADETQHEEPQRPEFPPSLQPLASDESGRPLHRPSSSDLPQSLRPLAQTGESDDPLAITDFLADWLSDQPDTALASATQPQTVHSPENPSPEDSEQAATPAFHQSTAASEAMPANVPGMMLNDFANRVGQSKRLALLQTGGDEATEAAVEAALRFLAADQRADGSWDPATSGAGRETRTLGTDRKGAGRRATTGITGLALLSMLGAGNTHQQGAFADNVRRGLTYLILNQQPNGSLAGEADVYEANYCHGLAALAMCEAAAMTGDVSAIDSAAAAVGYTMAMQHSVTGGWRYVRGDPGDMSQLGWQAMVLDAGRLAGVPTRERSFLLTGRFVRSVRGGQQGGLASYRPGDGPSRTMTAEALATRLLLGERVPSGELKEAEEYLLRQLPGVGRDNYYSWYYTSLALHQLQDDAWQTWNTAMKKHLLARQTAAGSWPTDSQWGGYGGRVYTTAMAALCLEVYYRHLRRAGE